MKLKLTFFVNTFFSFKAIVESISFLDDITTDGYTALHLACIFGRIMRAKLLIDRGANVNAKTNSGFTPLHIAIQNCLDIVVKHLIEANADVNM